MQEENLSEPFGYARHWNLVYTRGRDTDCLMPCQQSFIYHDFIGVFFVLLCLKSLIPQVQCMLTGSLFCWSSHQHCTHNMPPSHRITGSQPQMDCIRSTIPQSNRMALEPIKASHHIPLKKNNLCQICNSPNNLPICLWSCDSQSHTDTACSDGGAIQGRPGPNNPRTPACQTCQGWRQGAVCALPLSSHPAPIHSPWLERAARWGRGQGRADWEWT